MNILRSPSLHGRLSLVLTTLIAVMMAIGAGVWLLLRRCRHYSQLLRFPATIRSLHQLTADDKDG